MKSFFVFFLFTFTLLGQSTNNLNTGFRASRVLSSYPNNQFPSESYWVNTGNTIASKFVGALPAGIWIVSLYQNNGITKLNFPSNNLSIPYTQFAATDQNETYLSRFDSAGLKVWLQVEPGAAVMDTLISIVLNRYKNHSCVAGFGVDVEWYQAQTYPDGKKVTDDEATHWEQKVKAVNPNYTLFLKHYAPSWMPPTYRGSVLFVDDSQGFSSLNSMVNEFKSWGQKFSPNLVAFQYGYKIDSTWWKQYPDPMLKIGSSLLAIIPNCSGLFWVDFTINRIFPVTSVTKYSNKLNNFDLSQNYPNPFNPSTTIQYYLPIQTNVVISIFNSAGQLVRAFNEGKQNAGHYSVTWDGKDKRGADVASGAYFYQVKTSDFFQTKKMMLLK